MEIEICCCDKGKNVKKKFEGSCNNALGTGTMSIGNILSGDIMGAMLCAAAKVHEKIKNECDK